MPIDVPEYDVLIASRMAPTYTGGLANYQLALSKELVRAIPECRVGFLVFESAHPGVPPAREMPENCHVLSEHVREQRALWTRLASRPILHRLLESLIRGRFESVHSSSRVMPRARVIHFVGTGWDFFGFAMCDWARKTGARFTIWPAVHPGSWGDDRIDLRLYRQADMVICQSYHEAKHLSTRGLSLDHTMRCGLPPMCGSDGDGTRFREKFALGRRPIVLFAGRRDEGKGFHAMSEAWPQVLSQHSDAVLVLAGSGGCVMDSAVPSGAICDLEAPDDDTLADAFAAADIFCLPSAHESFGLVYVEAWSYGKPVICGTAPASRELVRESGGGIFSNQDPVELANDLLTLLDDVDLRAKLGSVGKAYQQRVLSRAQFVENHRRVFGI